MIAAPLQRPERTPPDTPTTSSRWGPSPATSCCCRRPTNRCRARSKDRSSMRRRPSSWLASNGASSSRTSGTPGMLDLRTLAITGLTRNGMWLVEDGAPTKHSRNMRFTQSYAQALMPATSRPSGARRGPFRATPTRDLATVDLPRPPPDLLELHWRRIRLRRLAQRVRRRRRSSSAGLSPSKKSRVSTAWPRRTLSPATRRLGGQAAKAMSAPAASGRECPHRRSLVAIEPASW